MPGGDVPRGSARPNLMPFPGMKRGLCGPASDGCKDGLGLRGGVAAFLLQKTHPMRILSAIPPYSAARLVSE